MIYFKHLTALVLLLITGHSVTAQWMWDRSGVTIFSPAQPSNLTFLSNPAHTNDPVDDSAGQVRFFYQANDADGVRRLALNTLRSDGRLQHNPERAFGDTTAISFTRVCPDRLGGVYAIQQRPILSTPDAGYFLQHYDADLNPTWPGEGVYLVSGDYFTGVKVAACKDGTAIVLITEYYYGPDNHNVYTRGLVKVFDIKGTRIGSGSISGAQFSTRLSEATLIPAEDEGVWLIFWDWIPPTRYYRLNKIFPDGSFLSEADTSLPMTSKMDAFTSATCIATPDGGLITVSSGYVQYYSPEGEPRWSTEESIIAVIPSTIVGHGLYSPPDSSLYLLLRDPRGGSVHNDLFYCSKVTMASLPTVQWTTPLSRFRLAPEWGYSYNEVFPRSVLIGTDYYYCFADTLWKLDKDGYSVWGEGGKHVEIGNIGNSFENKLYQTQNGDLLVQATVQDRTVLVRLDSEGNPRWHPTVTPVFPDRNGAYRGTTQLSNGNLHSLRCDLLGASIFDFSPDGWQIEAVRGRRILDFGQYDYWMSPGVSMVASAGSMLLTWGFGSGWEVGERRIQYLSEAGALWPEEPIISDTSRFYAYYSTIIPDRKGGYYLYRGGDFDHVYPDGTTEWEVPKYISPSYSTYRISVNPDLTGGFWFYSPYDSSFMRVKKMYLQRLRADGTMQFESTPVLPATIGNRSCGFTVSAGERLFWKWSQDSLSRSDANIEFYLTDGNLLPQWRQPITLFEHPVTAAIYDNYGASLGVRTVARTDGAIWALGTCYNRFSSSEQDFSEMRLQILRPDGSRGLGDDGRYLGKSTSLATIGDNRDGLWVIWDDFDEKITKALYFEPDGTLNPLFAPDGISVVDRPGFQLDNWAELQEDNSVIARLASGDYSDGAIIMQRLCADTGVVNSPAGFRLVEAFPNPFNSQCRIRYKISKRSEVKLTIYDLSGRAILTKSAPEQSAGEHTIRIDSKDWSAGIYFASLRTNGNTQAIKLLLVK